MICNTDDTLLHHLLARTFPAAQRVSFSGVTGQTNLTLKVTADQRPLLARCQPQDAWPFVNRRREYQLLKRLAQSGLVPKVYACNRRWLLLQWLPGHTVSADQFIEKLPALIAIVSRLHHQPLSGYRLSIWALLQQYWQLCRQHNIRWLRALKQLKRQGEPRPLRLATLHMDIHPGNIVRRASHLHLIDWEYAGDGDIALELAAMIIANSLPYTLHQRLLAEYARRNQIDVVALAHQVRRWQPWLRLLLASWYQLQAERRGDLCSLRIAADHWQQLTL